MSKRDDGGSAFPMPCSPSTSGRSQRRKGCAGAGTQAALGCTDRNQINGRNFGKISMNHEPVPLPEIATCLFVMYDRSPPYPIRCKNGEYYVDGLNLTNPEPYQLSSLTAQLAKALFIGLAMQWFARLDSPISISIKRVAGGANIYCTDTAEPESPTLLDAIIDAVYRAGANGPVYQNL